MEAVRERDVRKQAVSMKDAILESCSCPAVAVETGTSYGDTAAGLGLTFRKVYTIEMLEHVHNAAKERIPYDNVECVLGDSAVELPRLCKEISEPVFFYLDAHVCCADWGESAKENPMPLWDELKAIAARGIIGDVVAVDDAHTWGARRDDLGDAANIWVDVSPGTILEALGEGWNCKPRNDEWLFWNE